MENVRPPLLRLPSEIRLKIFRLLLLSDATIRMQWPRDPNNYSPRNLLFPAILSTCHLIYGEAMDVLYKENFFRAHRVNEMNKSAALIRRAKYVVGVSIGCGEEEAWGFAEFLNTHPKLTLLRLKFQDDLLEDCKLCELFSDALCASGYSSGLMVISGIKSSRSSFNEAQLVQAFEAAVLRPKNIQSTWQKDFGIQKQVEDLGSW